MRFLWLVILLCLCLHARGQYNPRKYHAFDDVKKLAYQDNFNTKRLLPLNVMAGSICATGHVQDGILQLLNNCRETIYTSMDLPVLYKGNFEIVAEVRIFCSETKEMLRDGFISWAVDSLSDTYNTFSFTSDKYYSFRSSDDVSGISRNKQYTIRDVYYYNTFARYTIRKYGEKYYFFVNGRLIGTAPYIETEGKLLEIGASPKAYTLYKLLAVYYLP